MSRALLSVARLFYSERAALPRCAGAAAVSSPLRCRTGAAQTEALPRLRQALPQAALSRCGGVGAAAARLPAPRRAPRAAHVALQRCEPYRQPALGAPPRAAGLRADIVFMSSLRAGAGDARPMAVTGANCGRGMDAARGPGRPDASSALRAGVRARFGGGEAGLAGGLEHVAVAAAEALRRAVDDLLRPLRQSGEGRTRLTR